MAKARRIHGLAIRPPAIKITDGATLSDTSSLRLTPLATLSALHPRQAIVDLAKKTISDVILRKLTLHSLLRDKTDRLTIFFTSWTQFYRAKQL